MTLLSVWISNTTKLTLLSLQKSHLKHDAWSCHVKNAKTLLYKTLNAPLVSLQVLIKPKPVFQTAVLSEQTRQLVTETLQQVTRSAEISQGQTSGQDGSAKDEAGGLTEASSLTGDTSHSSSHGRPTFTSSMV